MLLIERDLLDHQHRYLIVHLDMRLKLAVRHPGADAGTGALWKDILAAEVIIKRDADVVRVGD